MTNKYLIIIIAIIAMFASGCSRKDSIANATEAAAAPAASDPLKAVAKDPKVADQVKHTITTFDLAGLADDGSKKWDVKGQSAESVTDDQVKLNNVTASSYGKDAHATITADTGLYDKSKSNVHLEQNVKAVIENTGKGAEDFINTPKAPGDAAKPKDALTDPGKPKKTKTVITCDAEVEFNYEKNEGYFRENVHVVNDEGTIDADKITVYLDTTTKAVNRIVAEGNVKIQRGENMTFSDKATYIEAEKKIVLTGQPKLIMYQEGDFQTTDIVKPAKNPDFDRAKSG